MIKVFTAISICCLIFSCNIELRKLSKSEKWVNLQVCQPEDFLIFDFSNKKITALNNRSYKLKVTRKKFIIGDDSTLSLPYKKISYLEDTLKIIFDKENEIALLKHSKNISPTKIGTGEIINQLYLHRFVDDISFDQSKTYYLNFLANKKIVLTDINQNTKDTINNVFPYHIYVVDSINMLVLKNIFCNSFLLYELTKDTIKAVSTKDNRFYFSELIRQTSTFQLKVTKEFLIGFWTVQECSLPDIQRIKTLRITEDKILVNEEYPDKVVASWSLDKFGGVIVSGFNDELNTIQIIRFTKEHLTIENNALTYILKKTYDK
jgi:hypothetical protein